MHIRLDLHWRFEGNDKLAIDARLLALLSEIHSTGSIRQAAKSIGVSYRFAWGLLREWEHHFQQPLVQADRGRKQGASLSEFSQTLIIEDTEVRTQLASLLEEHSSRINSSLQHLQQHAANATLRVFISHDLLLEQLLKRVREISKTAFSVQVRGSLNNLRALANHECDVAGFHFPVEKYAGAELEQFHHYLRLAHASCIKLAIREQGLIVQKGNPKKIHRLANLTRRSVRFINRQQESGTRILLDSLLQQESIRSQDINGYVNEEYTHLAVAAMVASGAADVGIGLKAAADRFKLGFIPLVREQYCLALAPQLNKPFRKQLIEQLNSVEFQKYSARIAGYDCSQSGKTVPLQRLFA